MNIKRSEEIFSRYEGKIDEEKVKNWLIELETIAPDPNDPSGIKLQLLKTKEEIIADLIKFGLEKKDAYELEKALQKSKDENYEHSDLVNDLDKLETDLESAFMESFEGLFDEEFTKNIENGDPEDSNVNEDDENV